MAKKTGEDNGIVLTTEEVAALRVIVIDWLNEGLTQPPYDDATTSVLSKLGVTRPARAAAAAAEAADEEPGPRPFFPPEPNLG